MSRLARWHGICVEDFKQLCEIIEEGGHRPVNMASDSLSKHVWDPDTVLDVHPAASNFTCVGIAVTTRSRCRWCLGSDRLDMSQGITAVEILKSISEMHPSDITRKALSSLAQNTLCGYHQGQAHAKTTEWQARIHDYVHEHSEHVARTTKFREMYRLEEEPQIAKVVGRGKAKTVEEEADNVPQQFATRMSQSQQHSRKAEQPLEQIENAEYRLDHQSLLAVLLDEYGRFNVWAGNIGAHQVGRVSLDFRLRETGHLRDQIISLLQYLSETLRDSISIVNGTRLPYDEASSSSESDCSEESERLVLHSSETELGQLMQSVIKIVANLFKMSTIVRMGNLSQDRVLGSSRIDISYYESSDVEYAKTRFPLANENLITRLGKAISWRRQYLRSCKQQHETITKPPSSTVTTMFSTLGPKLQEPLGFDIDIEVISESERSDTSSHEDFGYEQLRLPPLPKESESGHDIECPYCFTVCKLTGTTGWARRREWKRHLFKDLQPYMCTFAECARANTMFERKTEWFRHESQVHRKEWSCNVPGHSAFQDKDDFMRHMRKEHDDSFAQAQTSSTLALFERPLGSTRSSCPLCCSEDAKNLSPKRLERHLGRHMEVLAFFALRGNNKSLASNLAAEVSTA